MSQRERRQHRNSNSDDHENVRTILEQISFEEVPHTSIGGDYTTVKEQAKSSMSTTKEDYEWQLLIVRKAVSNPQLLEQGPPGVLNEQLKASKSESNQPVDTGFEQLNWSNKKTAHPTRNTPQRIKETTAGPLPILSESSKKWNSSATLESRAGQSRDEPHEGPASESSESSDEREVVDKVTIIRVRRTQSSGVLAVTHRRHQSAPRQIGVSRYRRLTDPGCDVNNDEEHAVTDGHTGQGLDDGVNLSEPISLATQPRLIRVTNRAKRKTRHATQVHKRKSRELDDDKSSSGSHCGSSDSEHERTVWELDEGANKAEVSHASLYSKHIEPILRHTQQLMSTLNLDDDDQDEIEITRFTIGHHAEHDSLGTDEERCPAPDPIAMLCGDMLSNPDSPISPSTSDDEYEELDRAPTVNMSRAPRGPASKSGMLPTRSRARVHGDRLPSSVSTSELWTPGQRPQLRVNLASIHEASRTSHAPHTGRIESAVARQMFYKQSKSLPKFHVNPEPEHVTNIPQPTVPQFTAASVSQGPRQTLSPSVSPKLKLTQSTPYLTTRPSPALAVNIAGSGVAIPSPRRSAFVPASRLSTPRASQTDVHTTSALVPSVNMNANTNASESRSDTADQR